MKQITTSRNKTYAVDYCGIGYLGMLKTQIQDARPLGEIAPEFDGLESVEYTPDTQGEETFTFLGYSRLMRADRIDDQSVVIILAKEDVQSGAV